MENSCASCGKAVFSMELLKCIDQTWHRTCFKCQTCGMTLNVKNYKAYNKKPFCNVHYPQSKAYTFVTDNQEIQRVKQNTAVISTASYAGRKGSTIPTDNATIVVNRRFSETPKSQRANRQQQQSSSSQRGSINDFDPEVHNTANRGLDPNAGRRGSTIFASAALPSRSESRSEAKPEDMPPPQPVVPETKPEDVPPPQPVVPEAKPEELPPPQPVVPEAKPEELPPPQPVVPEAKPEELPPPQPVVSEAKPEELPPPQPVVPEAKPEDVPPPQPVVSEAKPEELPPPQPVVPEAKPEDVPPPQPVVPEAKPEVVPPPQPVVPEAKPEELPPPQPVVPEAKPEELSQQNVASVPVIAVKPTILAKRNRGRCFRARFTYTAQDPDEVSFNAGDIIMNGDPVDAGWMYGIVERTRQYGLLPANYVIEEAAEAF